MLLPIDVINCTNSLLKFKKKISKYHMSTKKSTTYDQSSNSRERTLDKWVPKLR